jgi:hypothetical protein
MKNNTFIIEIPGYIMGLLYTMFQVIQMKMDFQRRIELILLKVI